MTNTKKANEIDLFLFANVVLVCRDGQAEYPVPEGMGAASYRLEHAGLVQAHPTAKRRIVTLTLKGKAACDRLLGRLEGFYR